MIDKSDMNKLKRDFGELPNMISKNQLTEWFLGKQKVNRFYCIQASVLEIVNAAEKCGIKVRRVFY